MPDVAECDPLIACNAVRGRMAKAGAGNAGRHVTLVAVTKARNAAAIVPLLEAGQRDFGENRVQEAQEKWPPLEAAHPGVRLHLIGSLQTNKVKDALLAFDVIHTIDRESLVDVIVREQARITALRCREFFLQVNTGAEPQKGGVAPEKAEALLAYCRARGLPVTGLMCVPPAGVSAAPHFALLRTMADRLGLAGLSMGMSGDYETALRFGATHLRIGTALFGSPRI